VALVELDLAHRLGTRISPSADRRLSASHLAAQALYRPRLGHGLSEVFLQQLKLFIAYIIERTALLDLAAYLGRNKRQ
jgi:hypothetical protein